MADVDLSALEAALEKLRASGEDVKKIRQDLSVLSTQDLENVQQLAALSDEIRDAAATELASRERINAVAQIQIERLRERLDKMAEGTERQQVELELQKAIIEDIERRKKLGEEIDEKEQELLEKTTKRKETLEKIVELKKKEKDLQDDLTKSVTKMLSLKEAKGPFSIAGMKKMGQSFQNNIKASGGFGKAMKKLGPAMAVAVALKMVESMVNLATALYDAENAFMKTTGASESMAQSVTETYKETRKLGVTAKEAFKATADLRRIYTDFTMLQPDVQQELMKTTQMLGEQGFAYDKQAKIVQAATKGMGVSAGQSDDMLRGIMATAQDLNLDIGEFSNQLAQNADKLTKYGDEGVAVMRDLAIASKVTGIEMGRIIQIADKFDTFEGAAESAGMLNAALGGNFVNAMDLMTATNPVERMGMIKDAIDQTGLSFDEMGYYQRKMFAEAAGLKDEAELSKMMSGNFDDLAGNIGKTSAEYEKMAERSKKVQNLQEQFQMLLAEAVPVLTPIIDAIRSLTNWLAENTGVVKALVVVMGAITAALVVYSIVAGIAAIKTLILTAPVWLTVLAVLALIAAFVWLGNVLFKDSWASTFLEGLDKLANTLGDVVVNVINALNPFHQLTKAFEAFGAMMKTVLDSTSSLFNTLANPAISQNISNIVKEIAGIPLTKTILFTASMAATAFAGAVGGARDVIKGVFDLGGEGIPAPVDNVLRAGRTGSAAVANASGLAGAGAREMTAAPAASIRAQQQATAAAINPGLSALEAKFTQPKIEPKIDVYIGQEKLEKIAGEQARVAMGTAARDGLYGHS